MAKITTRAEFKKYCLRRLGWPVIQINVSNEQIEDRVTDALNFFIDYHFDGTEKIYMKHQFTQTDIDRRWIYCPDPIVFVTKVLPWDDSNASVNMFDLRYQLRLHDLYDFTSVSYVSYEITMQHLRTLNLLFSGTPQFRFNRKHNKLFLDIDWERDAQVGKYVIVECYRSMAPDSVTLAGTVTGNTTSNVLTGYSTTFDQEILENDMLTLSDSQIVQVRKINSPTEIVIANNLSANISNATMVVAGVSDVWDDRLLKQYATALIKYQWGSNLSKYSGVQMPGGVTLDGVRILQEAQQEIDKIEQEMQIYNVLPNEIFIG